MDTAINVGIGGAANVAFDYLVDMIPEQSWLTDTVKNAVKIAGGAVVGSMISNKYARAAADGIATVGVSNLVSGLISGTKTTEGLAEGTIGRLGARRIRLGQPGFARKRVAGVAGSNFMGC